MVSSCLCICIKFYLSLMSAVCLTGLKGNDEPDFSTNESLKKQMVEKSAVINVRFHSFRNELYIIEWVQSVFYLCV